MSMARFAIQLYVSHQPNAIVGQLIRRADADRAILYAENWLAKSRKSGRYFTVWYDRWKVLEVGEDGELCTVATGMAKDTEEERLTQSGKSLTTRSKAGKKSTQKRGAFAQVAPTGAIITTRAPLRRVTPARTQSNRAPRPSSTRERFMAMRKDAEMRLAQRGDIQPLGGSSDRQS